MRAFTLIELLFVIVIIAILSAVGAYEMRPNYLRNDTDFVLMKLKDVKYRAIGYSKQLSDLGDLNSSIGCIEISELNSTEGTNYKFHSDINILPSDINTLCFDRYGRPHKDDNNSNLSSLIYNNITIRLEYNNKDANITIYPFSGYIEAKY